MIQIALGLALWIGAHSLKRLAPALHRDMTAALGAGGTRAIIAVTILAGLLLIILGYERGGGQLFTPPPGAHLMNNVLMLAAIFLFGIGPAGGRLYARIRHPMLLGTVMFGLAHVVVTGHAHAVLAYGGLALWAVWQMRLINRHEGPWERPMPGNALQDWKLALTTAFLFGVLAGIHWLFGINVFAG